MRERETDSSRRTRSVIAHPMDFSDRSPGGLVRRSRNISSWEHKMKWCELVSWNDSRRPRQTPGSLTANR